ncbi:YqeG family HAD IIIA-type phosphatase [Lacticaseibacillus nasuensis]|uniref:HAD phosphatase, family IIIA n=1 Tax=Lacticaseibacillus nasuensis JCM 17158 TaxID=1291734 RepID=A0A0R1JL39_9LACO|nr:YqeG family HAD IIIA-type phosphatase [Lacticaseibacillus nasuensis]KRK71867.1 HAD phosphatase, family IIIA [Lacticaseibacillus nasuensis JCM 17158]
MAIITPTYAVKAIYGLTPEQLRHHGVRAILTDLDNTLIAWNNPDGTPELRQWLNRMHDAGIIVMVVSNNNADRVSRALAKLDLPFVSRALKPLPVGINRAVRKLHLPKKAVVMVGDQLLTDVVASNVAGVRSILVQPLIETDAWNTRINRFFEHFLFKLLNHRQPLTYQEDLHGNKRN